MNLDDFTIRLNAWASDLEASAAKNIDPPTGAALARTAIDNGIARYDDLADADPMAFTNPLDVMEAADWLTSTRGLICDGIASMMGPWVGYSRIAAGGAVQVRKHIVHSGDTLQSIAARLMGDWRHWPKIADTNNLDPASPLTVGAELVIPEPDRKPS